jgi:excisionase family DNA binding protein
MTSPARRASHTTPERLLSIPELAEYLGVPVATIYRWRYARDGPVGYRVGRHVRYRLSDIERWLDAQRDVRNGSGEN